MESTNLYELPISIAGNVCMLLTGFLVVRTDSTNLQNLATSLERFGKSAFSAAKACLQLYRFLEAIFPMAIHVEGLEPIQAANKLWLH